MSTSDGIQSAFLHLVKSKLGKHISLADELAEQLGISRDSAYRRIRGETILSLDEVSTLSAKYKISLDDLLSPSKDRVSFQVKSLDVADFSFEKWLKSILDNLELLVAAPATDKELIYEAKDLPIFHYFQFPRLAAFKIYFWIKTFAGNTKFNSGKYDPALIDKKLITMGEKIWERYAQIPSTEIVTYEIVSITLRQIEYAFECGMFGDRNVALELCADCSVLVDHLQQQAQAGNKFTFGQREPGAKFAVYMNEVVLGSNTILFKIGNQKVAFVTPNTFNILTTMDEHFCEITSNHITNMMEKSVLISVSASKERSKFFNRISETVQALRSRIA